MFEPVCAFLLARLNSFHFSSTYDSLQDIPRRTRSHAATGSAAGPRRSRLDEHGHRGHYDGWTSSQQCSSYRCGEPWRNSRQCSRHVRSWVADWAGYARLSSVWSRSAGGLPSLASARHLSQLGACAVIDGPRLVFRSFASQHAHRSRGDRARSSLFKSTGLGHNAAPPLFCCAPLHAGYESGTAHRLRSDHREPHQRGRKYSPYLRQAWVSRHGHGGFWLVHCLGTHLSFRATRRVISSGTTGVIARGCFILPSSQTCSAYGA